MKLRQENPPNELQYFKEKVKRWLAIDKQVSDQYLRKFNSEKKDLFNKVIMRNTVKDFFKTISVD